MPKNCPFCGTELELRRRTIQKSQPSDNPTPDDPTIYARDELYKCPNCYYVATFGIPISKEEYEKTKEAWGGHRIEDYWLNERGDDTKVQERLEALGYLM